MGDDLKSCGGKCRCSKRHKKSRRVPQRGPGVAELEKILNDQKHDQMKPLYAPPPQPPFSASHFPQPLLHFDRPSGVFSSMTRSEQTQEANLNSGLSFTQMLMMDDPMFQTTMNKAYRSSAASNEIPPANSVLDSFTDHSSSQGFHNNGVPAWPDAGQYPMTSDPRRIYALQLAKPSIENGNTRELSDQERIMLRNVAEASKKKNLKSAEGDILTLRPPSPTEQPSWPMKLIYFNSDSFSGSRGSEHKVCQRRNFGFNLGENGLSMDETKLSLYHNAAPTEEKSLDLNLKL